MVGFLEFFSAPFFRQPLKAEPTRIHWVAGITYKLHALTGTFLFFSSCLIFVKELKRDHLRCLQNGDEAVSEDAFNSYCYISSTFTLPSAEITGPMMYPGVRPHKAEDTHEDTLHHNYYQWVSYLLFVQSAR